MLPNFLIIGAEKSGTTALYHYLKQHPDIFMPKIKEPDFFAFDGLNTKFEGPGEEGRMSINNIDDYASLFKTCTGQRAVGEASPIYLFEPKASKNIHKYIPNVKIISILRNPIERAFSSYLMLIRDNRETASDFLEALNLEKQRKEYNWAWNWQYREVGKYYVQLRRYFELFDQNNIKIYLYEDFEKDPLNVLRDIFSYLEVNEEFVPNMQRRHNVSGMPKSQLLHYMLTTKHPIKETIKKGLPHEWIKEITANIKLRNLYKPELNLETRNLLLKYYLEDVLKLAELLDRDLSTWISEI